MREITVNESILEVTKRSETKQLLSIDDWGRRHYCSQPRLADFARSEPRSRGQDGGGAVAG